MTGPTDPEAAVFRPLLALFPSVRAMARDIGVPAGTARAWVPRDSVPPEYWDRIAAYARAKGIKGVTLSALRSAGEIAAQRHYRTRTSRHATRSKLRVAA